MNKGDIYIHNVRKIRNIDILSKIIYVNDMPFQKYIYSDVVDILGDVRVVGWFLICKPNVIGYLIGRSIGIRDGRYVFLMEFLYIEKKFDNHNVRLKQMMIGKMLEYLIFWDIRTIIMHVHTKSENYHILKNIGFKKDIILTSKDKHFEYLCYRL